MLPSKPRSGLSESSNNKTVPATPKVLKMVRAGSNKSDSGFPPLQKLQNLPKSVELKPTVERRLPKFNTTTADEPKSIESKSMVKRRSPNINTTRDDAPKSVESKPAVERRLSKCSSTPPDKQSQAHKRFDLQAQLGEVQEDLKKAKEQLAYAEREKTRVGEELKDAKNLVDEANEKLKDALVAQKKAEESLEIEKFRADELEQAGIEATQKREEEWAKELESISKKHSLHVETVLSTAQEFEKMKNELEATTTAKIMALRQAEDAMMIAETNAGKVVLLSTEVSHLKSLLASKLNCESSDREELIMKLGSEVDSLKHELERAKQAEEKLVTIESMAEKLRMELDNAKSAGQDSHQLAEEWKKKAEFLEVQLTKAEQSEKSTLESLLSLTKQLEETKASLQDSEFNTTPLREKVESLEDQLAEANLAEKSSLVCQSALAKQLEEVSSSLHDTEYEVAALRGKTESLEIEVSDAKKLKLDSDKLADEWKQKANFLEVQLVEVNQFRVSSSESLALVTKQLEESNSSLQDASSDIASLRVKLQLLEVELTRYKEELMDSERHLDDAQQGTFGMGKKIDDLKSVIQSLEEEKLRASNKEKIAASDAERFSEERNELLKELEIARQEEEKAKKAMEGLASALHEMSAEARETQEKLSAKRVEHEDAHAQIEQLRSALKNTEKNYEVMLDKARCKIVCMKQDIEKLEAEAKEKEAEWKTKELNCVSTVRESEKELVSFQAKMENMENGVKDDEEEIVAKLREAESRASCANVAVNELKSKTLRLKERLLDRENELQNITQENSELRMREAAAVEKVHQLSSLLAEVRTKRPEENGESSTSEKNHENAKKIPVECVIEELNLKEENENWHQYIGEEESVQVKVKTSEDHKSSKKDEFSTEMGNEGESADDVESKMESDSFDHTNGLTSETSEDRTVSTTREQQHQKKKKPLLQKFGGILKKKGPRK